MAHTHDIIDMNNAFTVLPLTREIESGGLKLHLVQHDHNSERVTFKVTRYVEGHDMSLCTRIRVHYNNISADKTNESRDVYIVDDVQVSPDTGDVVFSWLISRNATKHAGILSFLIEFTCLTGSTVDYAWHTALYSDILVGEGMNNGETVLEYNDVLEAWRSEILGAAAQATAAANRAEAILGDAGSKINRLDKRVTNLEQGLTPDPFEVDGSVAYSKTVPDGALPYAEVAKVGGMSYKSVNLLDMSGGIPLSGNEKITLIDNGIRIDAGSGLYGMRFNSVNLIAGKTYYFSAEASQHADAWGYRIYYTDGTNKEGIKNQSLTIEKDVSHINFYIGYGVTFDTNTTVTLQINEGSTALPYSPYFEGLRHSKVTEIKSESANLIPFPYYDGSRLEHNGITFTVNADGSIHVKGTATAEARFYLTRGIQWASENVYSSGSSVTRNGKTFKGVAYVNSGSYPLYVRVSVTESANGIDKTLYPTINYGDTALPFTPYAEYEPLTIPSAVQDLDGSDLGVNAEYNNHIDWDEKKYYKYCGALDLSRQSISKNTNNKGQTIWGIDLASIKDLGVCDKYTFTPTVSINEMQEGTIHNRGTVIYICDSSISSASEIKGTFIYALETPEVTDISHLLPDDNFIRVEVGGTITAVNEYGLAAPSEIIYQLKEATA